MKLLAGAVTELTLGALIILVALDYHTYTKASYLSETYGSLLPGRPGYLIVQLIMGAISSGLALIYLLTSTAALTRAVVSIAAGITIVIAMMDISLLMILIVAQSLSLLWYINFQAESV